MAAASKRETVPGPYRIPKMRPEFNPETAGQPVSTYELGLHSAPIQIAIADNGIIAITDYERTIHLYDRQYNPLHTFTYREMAPDSFGSDCMPTQMVFDGHGNILLAVILFTPNERGSLLRFNSNGKRLPEMSVPEVVQGRLAENHCSYYNVTGVTRDPHGNVFFRLIHFLSDKSISHVLCKQSNDCGVPTVLKDIAFGRMRQYVDQLAYGPNGHLYAACPDGILEIDATSGNIIQTISLKAIPVGAKECFSLTVSGDGFIFVVTVESPDVYVFFHDGNYLSKLSSPSSDSVGATAIDRDGFLHVVDPDNGRVYVF